MKKNLIYLFSLAPMFVFGQITDPKATEVWTPEVRLVTPGATQADAPSDAIVLFNGKNLDNWVSFKDSTKMSDWTLNADGSMTVKPGSGDLRTKWRFGSCQLHLEWKEPAVIDGDGQNRGNSGIFFQNRYEIQVLDCNGNKTYSNGQTGAIYKQHIPLANVCRKPGEWQTYDIVFTAPQFNRDGILVTPGRMTALQNGVLVQNNVEIKGTTEYIGLPKNDAHGPDFLKLQDHSCLVSYRNIWIRPL
jgi:hypothetical protein